MEHKNRGYRGADVSLSHKIAACLAFVQTKATTVFLNKSTTLGGVIRTGLTRAAAERSNILLYILS